MKRNIYIGVQVLLLVLLVTAAGADPLSSVPTAPTTVNTLMGATGVPASPTGSGFTYQGQLNTGSGPANGQYDFQFLLFDALTGGTQVGTTQASTNVTVANGLFTLQIDFGVIFNGQARWLEIGVRPFNTGSYITLTPRQPLTATPLAQSLMPGALVNESRATAMFGIVNTGSGTGIVGNSTGGYGLNGTSTSSEGVHGESTTSDAIHGRAFASNKSGVWGENTAGGVGVAGSSVSGGGVQGTTVSGEGVYGFSQNFNGVHGKSSSASNSGVWGENTTNGVGVAGSSNGTGKAFYGVNTNASGWAGYFDGNVHTTGKLTKAYTSGTSSAAAPIAYGFVSAGSPPTLSANTPNVTGVQWDAAGHRYWITIAGETITVGSHVMMATSFSQNSIAITSVNTITGQLEVYTNYIPSGSFCQCSFSFVVYKP